MLVNARQVPVFGPAHHYPVLGGCVKDQIDIYFKIIYPVMHNSCSQLIMALFSYVLLFYFLTKFLKIDTNLKRVTYKSKILYIFLATK